MAKTYEQIRAIGTFIKNTTIAKSVTNQMVGENIEDIADKMMSLDNGLKGYFTTIDSLLLSYPNPQAGWTAWVGAAYPGTVYDVVSGAWHNTTVVPPAEEVNLADYILKNSGAVYKGIATPTTVPGNPDGNIFYIANAPGIYSNFNAIRISQWGLYIFKWNGSWNLDIINVNSDIGILDNVFDEVHNYSYVIGNGGDNIVTTCSKLQTDKDGFVGNIKLRTINNSTINIVIGSINVNNRFEIRLSKTFVSKNNGISSFELNETIKKYEYIGIVGANSSFGYGITTEYGTKFIQYGIQGISTEYVNVDGFICLSYEFKTTEFKHFYDEIIGIDNNYNIEVFNYRLVQGGGDDNIITTSSKLQAKKDGLISQAKIYIKNIGNITLIVGSIINDTCTPSVIKTYTFNETGYIDFQPNIYIKKDEYLGIIGAESQIWYNTDNSFDSKFIQANTNGATTNYLMIDGHIGLSYKLMPIDILTRITDNELATEGKEKGIFTVGTGKIATRFQSLPINTWSTFYNSNEIYEGVINGIILNVPTSNYNITFGIGIIDQRGWAIIDNEFEINFPIAGEQIVDTSIILPKGKRLFLKGGCTIGVYDSGTSLMTGNSDIILIEKPYTIKFQYNVLGYKYGNKNVVSINDFDALKSETSNISDKLDSININNLYIESPTKIFKLAVDDMGLLNAVEQQTFKISIFGNSFEKHPITTYWWGEWGMAATKRNNDWIHKLATYLINDGFPTICESLNIANWETNASTFNYSIMDNLLVSNPNVVIIRIGENNSNTPTLTNDTITLINYIKTKSPNSKILFGGVFWTNQEKQQKMRTAVESFSNIDFIDFQDLDTSENKSSLGTKVYGDDLQWHTIELAGVAYHVGDVGHRKMAERMFPYVKNLLIS